MWFELKGCFAMRAGDGRRAPAATAPLIIVFFEAPESGVLHGSPAGPAQWLQGASRQKPAVAPAWRPTA